MTILHFCKGCVSFSVFILRHNTSETYHSFVWINAYTTNVQLLHHRNKKMKVIGFKERPLWRTVEKGCMIQNKNLDTIMSSCYKYLVQHFPVSKHMYLQQHQRLLLSLLLLVLDQQVLQRHDQLNIKFCISLQVRLYVPRLKPRDVFLPSHSGINDTTLQKCMREIIRINGVK